MKSVLRLLSVLAFLIAVGSAVADEALTFGQVLQRVLDTDPSLQVAAMKVQRARQENPRVESQLGWALEGQAGVARDTNSLLGTPTDRSDASANLDRKLASGGSVGLGAGYTREDFGSTFSPIIPNPADSTSVDLNYRLPLGQGKGNPDYHQGLVSAAAGVEIAEADWEAQRDQLARKTADLFFTATLTQARLKSAERAIARAERLKRYIRRNAALGIAEKKDRLQAEAQLRTQIAGHRRFQVAWEQQRTELNRLMNRPWDAEFVPVLADSFVPVTEDFRKLLEEAEDNNSDLRRNRARVSQAEAAIARARDAARNKMDVVLSVGNKTLSGNTLFGSISRSERIGGVRLEYRYPMDKRGFDAEINQALLDRSIALREISSVRLDLRYNVSSLLAEIGAAQYALEGYRLSLESEKQKLGEAEERYRTGRTETDKLIQFESDFYLAELSLEQQKIDLARKHTDLDILHGTLWRTVAPSDTREGGGVQ